jgi:PhnB protein
MQVQPYLYFDGRCEEALEFYKKALGAKVETVMRFSDAPADAPQPSDGCGGAAPPADKVMHSAFRVGDTLVMASDGMSQGKPEFKGISLTLLGKDEAEVKRLFAALSDGGQVQMPLTKTFFTSSFGMVADRFGVSWMLLVDEPTRP